MPSCRVLNYSFELPLPYAEGESYLTSSEASELNRLRTMRVIERARAIIRSRGPGADPDEVRSELEALARNFAFTALPFLLPPDPAQVEANKIAKALVQERLAKLPPGTEPPTAAELVNAISALSKEPRVMSEASRRVELARKVTQDTLGALDEFLASPTPSKDST